MFILDFLESEKKIKRIKNKRKNNREMRRWFSKFGRFEILLSNQKNIKNVSNFFIKFESDPNYLIPFSSKLFKNHILNLKQNLVKHSNY
jgi:hypothetical protein